jgi:hypothetical protein
MVKMRLLICLALLPVLSSAEFLPNSIGTHPRSGELSRLVGDQAMWTEFGLKDSEFSRYQKPDFVVSAWQLSDSTAAMAAFYWLRPDSSKPSNAASLAAETSDRLILVHGNYLLSIQGYKPSKSELAGLLASLPKPDTAPLPNLYLPVQDRVPNSERYITGPVALRQFFPAVSAELAGFQMGAEAQAAVFHSAKGDVAVAVFNYPTPQIAMKQVGEFQKAGLLVNRSGPLVTVTQSSPADSDLAQAILQQVHYQAQITVPEHIPTLRDNIGNLVINAFILTGILLCIALGAGLFVGAIRAFQRRGGRDPDANTIIGLHLE